MECFIAVHVLYFWGNVLKMEDAETEMIKNVNIKIVEGLKNS